MQIELFDYPYQVDLESQPESKDNTSLETVQEAGSRFFDLPATWNPTPDEVRQAASFLKKVDKVKRELLLAEIDVWGKEKDFSFPVHQHKDQSAVHPTVKVSMAIRMR